ncbi:MAG: DUF2383 domain-containing protein [Verrucomicrobiaceae bacterium]|nr:MAG: DUF2383 domain-containing protein [Verrucomicrobiaceae bacterium]
MTTRASANSPGNPPWPPLSPPRKRAAAGNANRSSAASDKISKQTEKMINKESNIKALNTLLRGEISAVETYTQAIEKFTGSQEAGTLQSLKAEHQESAAILRQHVTQAGGTPDSGSGAWGTFAQAVEGTAKLLGESAALKALVEGEQHGIKEYESALENEDVSLEAKDSIRDSLLPSLFDHIASLESLRV